MQNSRVSRKILVTLIVLGGLGTFLTIIGEVGTRSLAQSDTQDRHIGVQQSSNVLANSQNVNDIPHGGGLSVEIIPDAYVVAPDSHVSVNIRIVNNSPETISELVVSNTNIPGISLSKTSLQPDESVDINLIFFAPNEKADIVLSVEVQGNRSVGIPGRVISGAEVGLRTINSGLDSILAPTWPDPKVLEFPFSCQFKEWHLTRGVNGSRHTGQYNEHAVDFALGGIDTTWGEVVYATHNGVVKGKSWDNSGGGNMLHIWVGTSQTYFTVYLHLQDYLVNTNDSLSVGQPIAHAGGTSTNAGNITSHIHLTLAQRVSGNWKSIPFTKIGSHNYSWYGTNGKLACSVGDYIPGQSPIPADENIVQNFDFHSGKESWKIRGDLIWDDYDETLKFARKLDGKAGAIYQDLNVATKEGQTTEIGFSMGNVSDKVKKAKVVLRDSSSSVGQIECLIEIPPNTPLQKYMIMGKMKRWNNLRIEFQPTQADGVPALVIDNVGVYYRPLLAIKSTQCFKPTSETHWAFASKVNGWNLGASAYKLRLEDNGFKFTIRGEEPKLWGPTLLNVVASQHTLVWVKMKSSTDECGQLYFKRDTDSEFSTDRGFEFKPNSDKQSYIYVFQTLNHPLWTDNIVQLRLDPACNPLTSNPFPTGKYNEILIEAIGLSGPNKLKNRGFETIGTGDDTTASGWSVNKPSAIQRVCNEPEQPVIAKSGSCALRVIGQTGGNAIARQTIASIKAVAGDLLIVSGAVTATNLPEGKGKVVAIVTYTDGSIQKLMTKFDAGTYPYQDFANTLLLTRKVKNIRVELVVAGNLGQFTVDDLGVATGKSGLSPALKSVTHADGVIPLPAASTDLRGN